MNKQRFIERLNLHLDGELGEEETAELLSVVRENQDYRRIYIQYCQLFKACSQLGDKFASPRRVSAWRQKAYAAGGMAAALALLALAARNVTPLIDGFAGETTPVIAAKGVPAQALGEDDVEPLLVLDVPALGGNQFTFDEQVVPVSFDFEDGVGRGGAVDFETEANVRFSHYIASNRDKADHDWKRTSFRFGEAQDASTFEHEALSLREANEAYFSISSLDSDTFGESEGVKVRYDVERAAAVATPRK